MPEWSKKQLRKFWDDLSQEEKERWGSFKEYCDSVIPEID